MIMHDMKMCKYTNIVYSNLSFQLELSCIQVFIHMIPLHLNLRCI